MAKLTSAEKLAADIDQILNDYGNNVLKGVDNALKQLASKGRNAVKREARNVTNKKRRKYSNGWMYKVEGGSNRWAASAVIYNKRQPGIAHLLEHGHAKVGGGRTRPRVHIQPVEEQLTDEALRVIKKEIGK